MSWLTCIKKIFLRSFSTDFLFFRLNTPCLREEQLLVDWHEDFPYYQQLHWTVHYWEAGFPVTFHCLQSYNRQDLATAYLLHIVNLEKESPTKLQSDPLTHLIMLLFTVVSYEVLFALLTHPFLVESIYFRGHPSITISQYTVYSLP